MKMTIEECMAHVPGIITPEMERFAIEEVFKRDRYIFTTREGTRQHGYCTYCHSDFGTEGLPYLAEWIKCPDQNCGHSVKVDGVKHGSLVTCPRCMQEFKIGALRHGMKTKCPDCDSECFVRASGKGRKTLVDEAYFTYYQKSAIDPNVITAVGLYAVRDFSGEYRNVKTGYMAQSLFVFQPGGIGGTAFHRWTYYNKGDTYHGEDGTFTAGHYNRAGSVKCQFNRDHNAHIIVNYCRESIAAATKDTPFQYSTWEQYDQGDMTEFFDLFARYPCVEYLTKIGFGRLIEEKLMGHPTFSAIHWRGKTLESVLRLSKQELKRINKDLLIDVGFAALRTMQAGKKDSSGFSLKEANEVTGALSYSINEAIQHREHGNLREIYSYLVRQSNKEKKDHYVSVSQAFIGWRDYLKDCRELGFDLTKELILFPRNLHRAHQKTVKQVKYKADQLLNQKIKARVKAIKHLYFETGGLLIRPAASTEELITEGKLLKHCVGGYAKKYAEGQGDILFIRQIDEPDKPYFTVEVHEDRIVQCHGYDYKKPDEKINTFLSAFKAEKLKKSVRTNKKREVAV